MLYEGIHDCPEHIDCSAIVKSGGRVKAGVVSKTELEGDEEIRVSIRSTMYPSVEVFTLRNIKPADYQVILVTIPRNNVSN